MFLLILRLFLCLPLGTNDLKSQSRLSGWQGFLELTALCIHDAIHYHIFEYHVKLLGAKWIKVEVFCCFLQRLCENLLTVTSPLWTQRDFIGVFLEGKLTFTFRTFDVLLSNLPLCSTIIYRYLKHLDCELESRENSEIPTEKAQFTSELSGHTMGWSLYSLVIHTAGGEDRSLRNPLKNHGQLAEIERMLPSMTNTGRQLLIERCWYWLIVTLAFLVLHC